MAIQVDRSKYKERGRGEETCLDAVKGSVDDTRNIALAGQLKWFEVLVSAD